LAVPEHASFLRRTKDFNRFAQIIYPIAELHTLPSRSFRNNDEMDRAVAIQVSEGISFLMSRLPDQEKLDSILEHQTELKKQDKQERSMLSVDIPSTSHYFSEPELSPVTSPVGSRPSSPILSDSELEVGQRSAAPGPVGVKQEEQRWEWGQLPTKSSSAKKESKDSGPPASGSNDGQVDPGQGEKNDQVSMCSTSTFTGKAKSLP